MLNMISEISNQRSRSLHPKVRFIAKVASLASLAIGGFLLVIGVRLIIQNKNDSLLLPVNQEWLLSFTSGDLSTAVLPALTTTQKAPKIIYGFLPYWTVKELPQHSQLTHLGYFALPINRDGKFVTAHGDGAMGWRTYSSPTLDQIRIQAQKRNQQFEVLITMMDPEEISAFLMNPSAQETFFGQVKTLITSQPIDGINIDIEYAGEVDDALRTAYTTFIKKLSIHTKRLSPSIHLSIDVFADSALKTRIWDIPALAPHLDHIVIMTYDFYRSSSPQAGPVAPIFGSDTNRWDIDIVKTLKPFVDKVPANKLLLGIPFYGYEWRTSGEGPNASTYPKSGGLATYKRVQTLLQKDRTIKEQWDRDALSPYILYKKQGNSYVIYYENSRSLSYKLDLVNELGMGGIAIWALGYEGNAPELWTVIQQKLESVSK